MSLKVDKVQLEIILKGDATRVEIRKLEDEAKSLQKELKGMKRGTEEYAKTASEYDKVKSKIKELHGTIDLTAKTMRELTQRSRELRLMLNNTVPGTAEWKAYDAELKQVNARMRELRGTARTTESFFSLSAGRFNKYFALLGTTVAAITGLSLTFRKLAEDVAKMDDVYSDVMKTTGMTRDEVLSLNEELKKMDTRTAREELNKLARDAGKLGISSKKDVLDFVEAGNQINVALGEDLGDDAIKNIGKMVGVFDKSTAHLQRLDLKGKMLAVGSAINELGASSSASEPYLVQFAGRLGGIATQAGLSIDQILGFGSALDQDMQAVEMSATALQKFIMKIMGEPAKFAKIAGMEVSKFSELLRTAPNEAIKTVLRSLSGKGGLEQLIPIFKDMGLDGARAAQVISTMAGSLDKIDTAQRIANESMVAGVSLTNEYNIKNENLAAKLEKARKNFKEVSLELGESLNPILLKSTNATSYLIKGLVEMGRNWDVVAKILLALTGYFVAYNAQMILNNLLMKEGIGLKIKEYALKVKDEIVSRTLIIQEALYAATKDKTTIATKAAAVAQLLWNSAIKANPLGAFLGILTTVISAVWLFRSRISETNKEVNNLNREIEKERNELDGLFAAYNKANDGTAERSRVLDIIKTKYGQYISDLIDENGKLTDVASAYDRINTAIIQNLALKAKQENVDVVEDTYFNEQVILKDKLKKELKKQGKNDTYTDQILMSVMSQFNASGVDVNKTNRLVGKYLEDQLFQVTVSVQKILNKMASAANQRLAGKRVADETFDTFLDTASNQLNAITVTAKRPQKNNKGNYDNDDDENNKKNATKNPYADSLKELEEAQKKELLALKNGLISKVLTEDEFAKQGEAMLRQHLEDKLFLQKFWGESTVDTEIAIADNKLASQKTADERLLDQLKETNESRLQSLENWDQLAKNMLQDDVDAGLITSKQYQERLRAIELTSAQEKLRIAKDYLSEVENGEFHSQEAKEKAVKEATKAVVQATKDEEKAVKESTKSKLKAEEEYQKNREQVLKQYGLQSIRDRYRAELKLLKEHLKDKLITEKEFEQANKGLKLKAAEEYAQAAVQFAGYVADAVSAYHQMEADSLETEKQRELTAAGDNAEKREQIEKEYAQKELDLKKKQANADMAIKITQAVAAGALAAIQAYAQLGPIAGSVAAGIIAGMTLFQIASIKKQRDALMATTLNSSVGSSGNSGNNFSNLVANSQLPQTNQAADGRYDVVGADDGRTYRRVPYGGRMRTGVIGTPTLVAERGDELIIDHPTLRNIRLNAPHLINDMLRYRVQQRGSGYYSNVGESDSYTGRGSGVSDELVQALLVLLEKNTSLLQWLKENRIEAYTVLSDFEKKRELRDKSVKRGSL